MTILWISSTISAEGLAVDNGMFCRAGNTDDHNAFTTSGDIGMNSVRIKGGLVLDGAQMSNPDGPTLAADQITVDGGFCRAITSQGQIRLRSARVTGLLTLATANLTNPDGIALNAERIIVEGVVFCHDGFTFDGEIRLRGAQISGQLDLGAAPSLGKADQLGRELWASVISGGVDLRYAQVGTLRDEVAAWPPEIRLPAPAL